MLSNLMLQDMDLLIPPLIILLAVYIGQKISLKKDHKEQKTRKIPHHFNIETKEAKDNALSSLRSVELKKGNFIIGNIKLSRYLGDLLEGDPEKAIYGELVKPVSNLPLDDDNLLSYGYQYIVPETFKGELKSFGIQEIERLPEWLYSLSLISDDYEHELYLYFWSHTVLDEETLKKYIDENANISLARKYYV